MPRMAMGTTGAQERGQRSDTLIWSPMETAGLPPYVTVYRTKVAGGWLVLVHQEKEKSRQNGEGFGVGIGIGSGVAFVPDPEHRW